MPVKIFDRNQSYSSQLPSPSPYISIFILEFALFTVWVLCGYFFSPSIHAFRSHISFLNKTPKNLSGLRVLDIISKEKFKKYELYIVSKFNHLNFSVERKLELIIVVSD